jgi:aspartyl-tRNA synthetase
MFYENGNKVQIFVPEEFEGQRLLLRGRVLRIRDKGKLIWLDIMFEGKIYQAFINDKDEQLLETVKKVTTESVIALVGKLQKKPAPNLNIDFGYHELVVDKIEYLSIADPLPFNPHFEEAGETLMQQYRFLTLRKSEYYKNLQTRSRITNFIRNYMESEEFLEIETPTLVKSTPEGARDFLVPSRIHKGEFYALPQSPQLYKQVLMQSGIERYFQIARCYRDEALRGDRQLEFTQIDIEAAFYGQQNIRNLVFDMMRQLFDEMNEKLVTENEFYLTPNISYGASMACYGTDKPDLRFGLDLNHDSDGIYIVAPKAMTGKERSAIFEWVKMYMETLRHTVPFNVWSSSNAEKFSSEKPELFSEVSKEKEYTVFFLQDSTVYNNEEVNYSSTTLKLAGELRNFIGRTYFLSPDAPHAMCWITYFPMFEYSAEENRYVSMHHPFTRPTSVEEFQKDPFKSSANAYDLVIDGVEVGGGSVRIHEPELQKQIFNLLGVENHEEKFGGLLAAYKYGAVPHAGLALGLDRLCTFFGKSKKIGDYIAFPKNMNGYEAMFSCPSIVDQNQLKELKIEITKEDNNGRK